MEKKMIAVCSLDVCGSYLPSTFFPLTACPHTIINPSYLTSLTRENIPEKKQALTRSSVWACSAYVTLLGIVMAIYHTVNIDSVYSNQLV